MIEPHSDTDSNPGFQIAALVLAAGKSTRFGSDKRFSLLPRGKLEPLGTQEGATIHLPMAVQSILKFTDLQLPVFVVVPPEDSFPAYCRQMASQSDPVRRMLSKVSWIECKDHSRGMGHSLSSGVQAVTLAQFDACIVALADMPFIQTGTLLSLVNALQRGKTLVRPEYKSIAGHPVGFASEWFHQLMSSNGDEGAKPWLRQLKDQIHYIQVDDPGILNDVDLKSDLE